MKEANKEYKLYTYILKDSLVNGQAWCQKAKPR